MRKFLQTQMARVRTRFQPSAIFRILDARRGGLYRKEIALILEDVYGIRFVSSSQDGSVRHMLLRGGDRPQYEASSRLVRSGDTVFDVGAHIGLFCVHLSRLAGPSGRVFAFEPVPETCARLRETLALNRCVNVQVFEAALSNQTGTATMTLYESDKSEWNTLGAPDMKLPTGEHVSPETRVDVRTETLDGFAQAENIARIHLLKIDVEGFEKFAFEGAARLLRERRIDFICFEISQDPLAGAGVTAREVFQSLEAHGYFAYEYEADTQTFRGPIHDSTAHFANFFASWQDLTQI